MNTSRCVNALRSSVCIRMAIVCLLGLLVITSNNTAFAAESLSRDDISASGSEYRRMLLQGIEQMLIRYEYLSVQCQSRQTGLQASLANNYDIVVKWVPGTFYYEDYDADFSQLTGKTFIHDNTVKSIRYIEDENGQAQSYGTIGYPGITRKKIQRSFPMIYDVHNRLADHLRLCETGVVVCEISTEICRDEECYRVEFRGTGDISALESYEWGGDDVFRNAGIIETVWVAKEQFIPLKYETYNVSGDVCEEIIIEYDSCKGYGENYNYRLPYTIKTVSYPAGNDKHQSVTTLTFSEWEINRYGHVGMEFPSGITVTNYLDSQHPTQYVVR